MDLFNVLFVAPFLDMADSPVFFAEGVISGVLTGVMYSLVALGFVLNFKASGVFNFAQAEFGTTGLFAAYAALTLWGWSYSWAIAFGLAVAVAMGLFGVIVLRHGRA